MKILSYPEIIALARDHRLLLEGVEYTMSATIARYLISHMPVAGDCFVGVGVLVISRSSNDIKMFLPDGPPDGG